MCGLTHDPFPFEHLGLVAGSCARSPTSFMIYPWIVIQSIPCTGIRVYTDRAGADDVQVTALFIASNKQNKCMSLPI